MRNAPALERTGGQGARAQGADPQCTGARCNDAGRASAFGFPCSQGDNDVSQGGNDVDAHPGSSTRRFCIPGTVVRVLREEGEPVSCCTSACSHAGAQGRAEELAAAEAFSLT